MMLATILLVSIACLMAVLTVHNPGRLLPGMEGIQESLDDTVQIDEANTEGVVTFALEGGYDVAPRVFPSAEISAQSGGSATTEITRVKITSRSATEIEVTVELDAAPGAGETTDVRVDLYVAGV